MTHFHSPWFSLAPYPEIALTDLLAPSAERYADRPAFINFDGRQHSFAEIWSACRRVGPEIRCGACADKSSAPATRGVAR